MDVGNLISGSFAFPKSSLNIWKFSVHILCGSLYRTIFGIAFFWDWNENWLFQSCDPFWVFQICWHIECSTLTASSFRIWNSSTGIPSPSLALFVVMLPNAHLTLHSRISRSSLLITPSWLSGSWRSFLYSSVYSCYLFLISSASNRSIPFLSFIERICAWNIPLVSLIFLKRSLVFSILLFSSISHRTHQFTVRWWLHSWWLWHSLFTNLAGNILFITSPSLFPHSLATATYFLSLSIRLFWTFYGLPWWC